MAATANCSEAAQSKTTSKTTLKDVWSIRPCEVYKEEYDDCTSFKARFHQYFIFGENIDCSQWQTDYKNCTRYRSSNEDDIEAGEAVVRSEELRRVSRLGAHYANDTWKKRTSPPEDWAKPLPEWLAKRNENTYLEVKQMELDGVAPSKEEAKSYCVVM